MKNLRRDSGQDTLIWSKDNVIIKVGKRKFLQKHDVANVIRLRPEEYAAINPKTRTLTLFNLQHTPHQPGKRYLLTMIVRPGHYTPEQEVLPVLSWEKSIVVECISAKNNLRYSDLSAKDFRYSIKTVQTIPQLRRAILHKYCQSRPGLSTEEMVTLGVAVTTLKIIDGRK